MYGDFSAVTIGADGRVTDIRRFRPEFVGSNCGSATVTVTNQPVLGETAVKLVSAWCKGLTDEEWRRVKEIVDGVQS